VYNNFLILGYIMNKFAFASLLIIISSVSSADVLQVTPSKDNSMFDGNPNNSNGSGTSLFVGRTSAASLRRALIQFDVSAIPAGSTINSVAINLTVNQVSAGSPGASIYSIHQALQDWGEGSSIAGGGSGAAATVGDATWAFTFFSTASWMIAGGDYNPLASQSTLIDGVGGYNFSSSALLVADIQAWVDSGNNFGWVLIGDETANSTARRFDSREGTIPPQITIDYTPPVPVELMNFSVD
jgi:hypothetical protein